jgi:hypothetical protein
MLDYQLENNLVNDAISPGEKLLWSGRPNPKRVMMQLDSLILVVFSIPWTAFALFWVYAAAGFKIPDFSKAGFEVLFPLFGVPFVLIGFGLMFSPLWKYLKAKQTIYVITDKRCLIIVNNPRAKRVEVILPQEMGNFEIKERVDRTGDLIFARENYVNQNGQSNVKQNGFWGIPEVRDVEQILENTFKTQ